MKAKDRIKNEHPFEGIKYTDMKMPKFSTEKEEAEWWDSHPQEVEDLIVRAESAGAVTQGTVAAAMRTKQTNIRMYVSDIERATKIAHRKGLKLQTYIKMVLHEALEREQKVS